MVPVSRLQLLASRKGGHARMAGRMHATSTHMHVGHACACLTAGAASH